MKVRLIRVLVSAALSVLLLPALPGAAQQPSSQGGGGTLGGVKARGMLRCGVNPGLAGFAFPDSAGAWRGLDIDACRAVATAVLGDAGKVQYVPLTAKDRFTALQSGEVDLLARNASWTLARNTQLGINFVAVNFYDGQAFMVKAASGIASATRLDGASVCVIQGTSTEKTLADYFRRQRMRYEPVSFADADAVAEAYEKGRCDVLTSDQSQLSSVRSRFPEPKAHVILPEIITKEPLALAVRNGDDQWANVVRWSFFATLEAEELGLTSRNVREQAATSTDPAVQRFTGKTDGLGPTLGLDAAWATRIVEQVGNYAESYERNIRPIGLDRGVNRLWRDGGYMISPPVR